MAITVKEKKIEGEKKTYYSVEITNTHTDALKRIVKRYNGINDPSQALDFIIKAAGKAHEGTSGISINGVKYIPANYSE